MSKKITIRMKKDEVVVYMRDSCLACDEMWNYLQENDIAFTEKNVGLDLDIRREQLAMGYKTLPLTIYNGNIVAGFNKKKLDEIFKQLKKSK